MQEEAALQVTDDLYKRIAYLEKRIQMLEQKATVYGSIPTYEPAPYWTNPNWIPPKVTYTT
jgi:hypothetical protein